MFTKKKVKNRSQSQQRKTIDTTHNNQLKTFEKFSKKEKDIRQKYENLKCENDKLSAIPRREMSDEQIERYFEIQDKIKQYEQEIEQNTCAKNEYFLKTGHILFDYYGQKEKDQDIPSPPVKKERDIRLSKSVIDFFNSTSTTPTSQTTSNASSALTTRPSISQSFPEVSQPSEQETSNASHKRPRKKKQNLNEIIKAYMHEIKDETSIEKPIIDQYTEYCKTCHNHKIFIESESILLCNKCGVQEYVLMNQNKPSYKDPPREYTFFAYKRINHFNEWLSQFQAKESTHIPDQIIEDLQKEIKKEKITDISKINTKRIRRFLKKLGYNKYYEHIPHIINKLNGVPPPIISHETEEKLRAMFKMIQVPFLKHCPPKRKNFLSYSYVLHKFVELLQMPELIPCFPLLKSRQKLYQQDLIWKNICSELQWTFVKSV